MDKLRNNIFRELKTMTFYVLAVSFYTVFSFSFKAHSMSCSKAFQKLQSEKLLLEIESRSKSDNVLLYNKGDCDRNVYNLLVDLEIQNINIKDIKVHIIEPAKNQNWLLPKDPSVSLQWSFHVVFSYKNKVFDFDHLHLSNQMNLNNFLIHTLKIENFKISELRIRTYTAIDYLNHMSDYQQIESFPLSTAIFGI